MPDDSNIGHIRRDGQGDEEGEAKRGAERRGYTSILDSHDSYSLWTHGWRWNSLTTSQEASHFLTSQKAGNRPIESATMDPCPCPYSCPQVPQFALRCLCVRAAFASTPTLIPASVRSTLRHSTYRAFFNAYNIPTGNLHHCIADAI